MLETSRTKAESGSETVAAKLAGAIEVLAALESEQADLALAAVQRQFGAAEKLTAHRGKVAAAKTAVEELQAAQVRAQEIERMGASARIIELRNSDIDDLLVGISTIDCCEGCSTNECVIGPGVGRCCHPNKGGLPPAFMNDETLRRFQQAARAEIVALERGDADEDDDSDEEEAGDAEQ
ncbi:hypothetical protein [Bradyrhizobium sp. WSM2793]|uniref:hypothetical protein n=1 Tax=Bradyrhizobium sp. WSM2793 TaxID=1038866 RepID=UPI00067612ED|nr:hypothetical protein [Bradyrhizobium sp. WSM2793]